MDSDILRSSGNVAKVLNSNRESAHSPPTRDAEVSQSSESTISTKDILNKHQANISRLAQAFGIGTTDKTRPNNNRDLDELESVNSTPVSSKQHRIANLEDSLGQVKTLFDKTHAVSIERDFEESRPTSALEKRASEESFNVERFKDRLFNLSQTATKKDVTTTPDLSAKKATTEGSPSDLKQTNILIRPVSCLSSVQEMSQGLVKDASADSLYEQIKKKYMATHQSTESLTLGASLG